MKLDPNLTSLTDEELVELFEATLDRSRANLDGSSYFYIHRDFELEISRRVYKWYEEKR